MLDQFLDVNACISISSGTMLDLTLGIKYICDRTSSRLYTINGSPIGIGVFQMILVLAIALDDV